MHQINVTIAASSIAIGNNNNSYRMLASVLRSSIESGRLSKRQLDRKRARLAQVEKMF